MAVSYTIPQFLAMVEVKNIADTVSVKESLNTISQVCKYILNPSKIFMLFWNWTYELSYLICVLVALFGFFMVLLGNKNFKKYISGSIVSYFFINILNMFITQ